MLSISKCTGRRFTPKILGVDLGVAYSSKKKMYMKMYCLGVVDRLLNQSITTPKILGVNLHVIASPGFICNWFQELQF